MKRVKFIATARLGKNLEPVKIPFSLRTKTDEMEFSWDDVFDGGCDAVRKLYPEDDFPNMEIEKLEISMEDGTFPVVAEDHDENETKKLGAEKVLVLGYERYSITPEFKFFLDLVEKGIFHDYSEFDIKKIRKIIEDAKNL